MRQYVVTEEEMQSLLDQLQLRALQEANLGVGRPIEGLTAEQTHSTVVQDMHRSFHYVAVRWSQAMGFKGYRQ